MYKAVIVEDEMFVRMGIKMSVDWEKLGIGDVETYANGQQAWEAYQEEKPDLILTDLKMPVMSGMELIRKIREQDDRTRIIILSCLEEFALVREALSLGVTDYILKLTMTQEDMAKVIDKALTELRVLDEVQRNKEVPKEQLEDLLLNVMHYKDQTAMEKLEKLSLPFYSKKLMLAAVQVGNEELLKERFRDKYGGIVSFSILNILDELIGRSMKGMGIRENGQTYLILASEEGDGSVAEYHYEELLRRVQKTFFTYFGIKPSIAVSQICNGLENLNLMYGQCETALESKFFYPPEQLLFYKKVLREDKQKLVEEQLDAFLEQGLLPEKSRSFLQDSREELLLNLNYKTFYQAYLQMAETQIRENAMSDQQRRQCVSDAQKCMEYAQTLQELQEAYLKFCEKLNSAMFGNTAYVSKPVSMAVEYIRRNYKNDISLEDIAEHAQVSSHYICSLFKKEIGMNVSKYVMEYRISKAKTLLMTTNMKSYEVAVETGFANESYFSRSFKKVTGFSPSDFRREICEIQGEI